MDIFDVSIDGDGMINIVLVDIDNTDYITCGEEFIFIKDE